jgi:hypothetical protein
VNNPYSLEEVKESIQQKIYIIPRQLCHMYGNIFQDVRHAEKQKKVGISRLYSDPKQVIMYGENRH